MQTLAATSNFIGTIYLNISVFVCTCCNGDVFSYSNCRVAPKIIGNPIPPLKSKLAPPACNTFEDMKETVIPALILLGPSLHYDPVLMYKVSK